MADVARQITNGLSRAQATTLKGDHTNLVPSVPDNVTTDMFSNGHREFLRSKIAKSTKYTSKNMKLVGNGGVRTKLA